MTGRGAGALVALAAAAFGTVPATASAASHQVTVADFEFEPAEVTVAPGDTVVWTQEGSAPHTVTAADGSFDSHPGCSRSLPVGCMTPGARFERTFPTAGTVAYYCKLHGTPEGTGMAGRVVVASPGTPAPAPTAPGATTATTAAAPRGRPPTTTTATAAVTTTTVAVATTATTSAPTTTAGDGGDDTAAPPLTSDAGDDEGSGRGTVAAVAAVLLALTTTVAVAAQLRRTRPA